MVQLHQKNNYFEVPASIITQMKYFLYKSISYDYMHGSRIGSHAKVFMQDAGSFLQFNMPLVHEQVIHRDLICLSLPCAAKGKQRVILFFK